MRVFIQHQSILGIHGREWISPATATYFIRELVEIQSNASLALLAEFDVYILPVANPDGLVLNYFQRANLIFVSVILF